MCVHKGVTVFRRAPSPAHISGHAKRPYDDIPKPQTSTSLTLKLSVMLKMPCLLESQVSMRVWARSSYLRHTMNHGIKPGLRYAVARGGGAKHVVKDRSAVADALSITGHRVKGEPNMTCRELIRLLPQGSKRAQQHPTYQTVHHLVVRSLTGACLPRPAWCTARGPTPRRSCPCAQRAWRRRGCATRRTSCGSAGVACGNDEIEFIGNVSRPSVR